MKLADVATLREQAGQAAADLRQERTWRLGPDAVTWLALPPQWTGRLAEACGFPASGELLQWIEEAVAAGLCQRQALLSDFDLDDDEGPDVRFWMPENERAEVLGDFRSRTALRRLAAEIGTRIMAAPASIERDPGLDRWADLAVRSLKSSRMGDWLTTTVVGCVSDGRMAEALDWLYAAEVLAPVLGQEIASAAARAKRLINLEYRRRTDARFIKHFLPRPRQQEEIERLLSSRPPEAWALHFVGMGGVGKTMFIRYLSGGFTAAGGSEIVTTRVDFDHISPRYPAEQPGQLLRELAGGLTGQLVEADQVNAYRHFVECADALDRLKAAKPDRSGFSSAEFENVLSAFADLVSAIGKRVVLILDTCEELAKLHPAGEPVPGIERTFEILERLHEKADGLRVILAGRRLLAARYANWSADADGRNPAWAVSLATRDYLKLSEVRGFTEPDARRFLTEVRQRKGPMPPDVEKAILRASPDSGRVTDLLAAAGEAPALEEERLYNPYELELYADWFEASGGALSAAEIASGNLDAYVEGRIIGRLPASPPVARVLPALAVLGRVDEHLVRVVLALPEAVADRGFRLLAEQEWIVSRAAEESGVTVLEVQSGLLRRLEAYYSRAERVHVCEDVRVALCREIPLLIGRRPLDAAAVEHVAAAMRILPSASAVTLWDELTARIVRDDEWTWAISACSRLLASEGDDDAPRPALEAAVRAVYIGALRRTNPAYDVAREWAFVAAAAARHPDKKAGAALGDRAAFGIAAARARRGEPVPRLADDPEFSRAWSRTLAKPGNDQRLAAALAAVEALLDAGADEPSAILPPADEVHKLVQATRGIPVGRQLRSFARLVEARTLLRAKRSSHEFAQAERLASATPEVSPSVDWPLPRSAQARIRLQWLHATVGRPDAAPPPDQIRTWLDGALEHDDIEHERLASAALLRLLGRGPVSADIVQAVDEAARRIPPGLPQCPAHVQTPPLTASAVRAWVALGDPDSARALIEAWEESSSAVDRDAASTGQVRLATVYLIRRMRWLGLRDSLILTLATDSSPEQLLAARATQTLLGRATETPLPASGKAAARTLGDEDWQIADVEWRTGPAVTAQDVTTLLDTVAPLLEGPAEDPVLAAHLQLDRREASRLSQRAGRSLPDEAGQQAQEAELVIEGRLRAGAGSPAAASQLRAIRLRRWAMADSDWTTPDEMPRDWAETALEEGELLALKLPDEGKRLLELAVALYDEAGDVVAATLASVARALAFYHDRSTSGARPSLVKLRERYDRLQALPTSRLPAWDELVNRSRDHREDSAAAGAWNGWLIRVAACIEPDRELKPASPELNLTRAGRRLSLAERIGRPGSWTVTAVGYTTAAAFYIVLGAWGGRAALGGFGWHPSPVVGWAVGCVAVFAVFIAVILGGVVSTIELINILGAQLRLDGVVDAIGSTASPEQVRVGLRIQGKRVDLDVFARYFPAFLVPWANPASSKWSSVAGLPSRPDPLRITLPLALARTLRRAGTLHADEVTLRIGPQAVPGAWEAVIGVNQVITAESYEANRFFRSCRVYPARKPRSAPHAVSRVSVLCALPFALSAEESWEAAGVTPQLFHDGELRGFERQAAPEILHLIGTPVPGEIGPVLTPTGDAAQAIQPDRLPLAEAALVVVQAEPTRSSVSVDPRSDLARVIAHDIAEASGGAAVLMVPALPSDLGVIVMKAVARAAAAGQLSRTDLLDLVERLRIIVMDAADPQAARAARALPAFDICLYVGA
jgi:hypothetical protein